MKGELKGLPELRRKLRLLPEELRLRGFRSGMRTAAKVVEAAAKLNAKTEASDPETGNDIARNITTKFSQKAYKNQGRIMFRVGVQGAAIKPPNSAGKSANTTGNPGGDTWYWRFIEFGTSRQRARPFMRPALENNAEIVAEVAQTEIAKAIDRAVRKLGAK
jgi:HK97 gp10 family phage protein